MGVRVRVEWLSVAQVVDVHVSAEADVVGEIPAVVIGIVVEDDVVGIPGPIVTEGYIVGCDTEVEATEPESRRAAADDAIGVAASDASREVAVLPGMIEVVVNVGAASGVADPFVVGVHVRGFGVAFLVGELWMFRYGMRIAADWSGAVCGNVSTTDAASRMGLWLLLASGRLGTGNGAKGERGRESENECESVH
jgi:hypothetical protein